MYKKRERKWQYKTLGISSNLSVPGKEAAQVVGFKFSMFCCLLEKGKSAEKGRKQVTLNLLFSTTVRVDQ